VRQRLGSKEQDFGVVVPPPNEGRPVLDPHSTNYVGAIETAEEFGKPIYAQAVRRGLLQPRAGVRAGRWGSFEFAGLPRGVCCPEASVRQFNSDVFEIHIAVVQDAHEEQLGVGFRPVKRSANSFKR